MNTMPLLMFLVFPLFPLFHLFLWAGGWGP